MSGIIKSQIIWKALDEAVKAMGDRRMLVYKDKEISFKEIDEASDRVASGLLKLGFKKGERIGIIGLNQPEWLYTYFAASKIGAAIVGLNVRYRDQELEYMLNQSESRGLVSLTEVLDIDYVEFFKAFRNKIPSVKDFIFIGEEGFTGSHSFDDILNSEVDRTALDNAKAEVEPEDLMIIIYTSGTTGKPKGAAITHKSQLASARAQAEHSKVMEDDLNLLALPFNHVGGITCGILVCLLGKASTVIIPTVDLNDIIKQWSTYKPTLLGGVPTLFTLLFMSENFKTLDTSSVRLLIVGGSNAEPELLTQINEALPNAKLMKLYGLSESSGALVLSPWDSGFERTVRSIGKPIGDFEVKAIDSKGKELPAGETGELWFRGDAVCKGYFRMPEETEESFDKDGWLHTGDMGYIDEDGYISLMGRKKEMYLQGGFNVYPVEIENFIAKHPKVQMVAGISVSDPVLGEVGRYYIVPKPGSNPTENEIKDYCKEHLADYKVPKQVVFRESLPLTPIGKIMKLKLKEEYEKSGG